MGIWGWGWGREEEATLIWEGSRHHCVGITKRGEGEGGKKNGGGPDPNHTWGWGSLLPSIHPWKKVVGYYANASLRPPEVLL